MARPKKRESEKRTEQVNSRYTLAERLALEKQAQAAGMSLAEYQCRRTLGHIVKAAPSPVSAELVREINRVGVNLNQVQKTLNATSALRHDTDRIMAKLEEVIDRLLADMA